MTSSLRQQTFACWKTRFKTEVYTCPYFLQNQCKKYLPPCECWHLPCFFFCAKLRGMNLQRAHTQFLGNSTRGNPPNHAQPRGAQVSRHLLLMGEVRGMTKHRPHNCARQQRRPTSPPSHFRSTSEEPILVSGFGFCQERQEFCVSEDHRPPHLNNQHDKSRSNQFGMSSFLSSSGRNQCNCIGPVSPCSRRPVSPEGTHQCGVHCKLGTSLQWQTIHHLQFSGVSRIFQIKIEIAHQNVGGNSSTCFPTDPRRDTLRRKSPSDQYPCSSACCAVMAMSIEEVATPARTHGKRKRQLATTEQEHSEQVRIQIGDAARALQRIP